MSKQLDAVTFGEPMAMFYANEAGPLHEVFSFSKALAGAESNVATGLSRLNHPTGYVTKLGEDNFGTFIAQAMKNENINTDNITFTKEYSTGMLIKSKVVTGDPKVEYFRKTPQPPRLVWRILTRPTSIPQDICMLQVSPPLCPRTVLNFLFTLWNL